MSDAKPLITRDSAPQSTSKSEHSQTEKNRNSVRKVSDDGKAKTIIGKGDSRYWTQKGKLLKDKRSPYFFCKIQVGGNRESFPLRTANKETAASKAAQIFNDVVANGWELALARHKPKTVRSPDCATIGAYVAELQATVRFRKTTWRAYIQALRSIAAGVAEIGDQPALDENGQAMKDKKGRALKMSRRDRYNGGVEAWQAKIDALPLSVLSDENIDRWKVQYLDGHSENPIKLQRARHTLNSMIRSARSLFSDRKDRLKHLRKKLVLPHPLPLKGVALEKEASQRYVSKVDGRTLITDAQTDLASDPARLEQFKIFCLAMLAGLRKREIDTLLWEQVMFELGQINLRRTEHTELKSNESEASVDCDPELMAFLRDWKSKAKGPFVIESEKKARYDKAPVGYYRTQKHFVALYKWLEAHGISDQKKLHTLRKELGSILANEQGIFAAQQVLRHAHIQTTSKHYADKRQSITAGLGALLCNVPERGRVIEFRQPIAAKKRSKAG